MKKSGRILFISNGEEENGSPGLRQAILLAEAENATLTILSFYPDLPEQYLYLQQRFEDFLETVIKKSFDAVRSDLGIAENCPDYSVIVRDTEQIPPPISIIREVIRTGYDLVIKDAEPVTGGKGFKGMDMTLLRKCPAPVWLARPSSPPRREGMITVAIDPEIKEAGEHDLSLKLLREASALVGIFNGTLDVVSCWEYEFEKLLRYKAWVNVPEQEIQANIETFRISHKERLDSLIEESGIGCKHHVHHMRGRAEDMIPSFLEQRSTDILIMGSVARTGIPGFLIGNTAENIFERTSCTLLALKPDGYVSPVTL